MLASTQDLHEKISELSNRVRDLEDALRDSHRQLSGEQHPLLAEDLLRIKAPLERESNSDSPRGTNGIKEEAGHDVVDSFGSLSISHTGKQKFYGHTANSWVSELGQSPSELIQGLINVYLWCMRIDIGLHVLVLPTSKHFTHHIQVRRSD